MSENESKLKEEKVFNFNGEEAQLQHIKEIFTINNSKNDLFLTF